MQELSPIAIAIVIAGTVALVGIMAHSRRRDATFAGYEDLARDLKRIRRRVRGQCSRDGEDFVITGQWRNLPAVLRFSHRDDAPGIHIRMSARATFALDIALNSAAQREGAAGRVPVRLPDLGLNHRLTLLSDSPPEVALFADLPKVPQLLRTLCASAMSSLAFERGAIEFADLRLPQRYLAKHVMNQVNCIAGLAAAFENMPHSDRVRVPAIKRQHGIVARTAMVAGAVAAIVAVASASYDNQAQPARVVDAAAPRGVAASDAAHIPGVMHWRLLTNNDLDPATVEWLRENGQNGYGKVALDVAGDGSTAVAYALARPNSYRVVLLHNNDVTYDVTYPSLAAVVRVPAANLSSMDWQTAPTEQADGDGLLLVFRAEDHGSGLILYSHEGRVLSAAPSDYERVPLN